jgi:arylsulfatase A-like enzyme
VTRAAGYTPVYKGKFHCNKPANGSAWFPSDVNQYGFTRWDPPDAGANQDVSEEGGGTYDNDGRFMNSTGTPEAGTEGAVQYLSSVAAQSQPFFMVVSLVNPHDVLLYPTNFTAGGYGDQWLDGEIGLPETVNEDLSAKPTVQEEFLRLFNASSPIPAPQMKVNYLNFYGNLMKASDTYLVKILDTLQTAGLLENTLVIATADHGEMGTAHGGLRQKNFNFYEETTRVPLVYSNPRLFPRPERNFSLVSHVDFLPTLASLLDAPAGARAHGRGSITQTRSCLARSGAVHCSRRRTTRSLPTMTGSPGSPAGPTRSRRTTSSASASTATSSPGTTTPTAMCPTSTRCMTWSSTRSGPRTSPTPATGAPPSRTASTHGSGASSPWSSRPGSSR